MFSITNSNKICHRIKEVENAPWVLEAVPLSVCMCYLIYPEIPKNHVAWKINIQAISWGNLVFALGHFQSHTLEWRLPAASTIFQNNCMLCIPNHESQREQVCEKTKTASQTVNVRLNADSIAHIFFSCQFHYFL